MRQILIHETNTNLLYIYFDIYLIDGKTPADSEDGAQPEVNINGGGWTSEFIGTLQTQDYGYYRALLTNDAVSQVGTILSHYVSSHTVDSKGEPIQVVTTLSEVPIFEESSLNVINLTYANFNEAESYFSTRLVSKAWENASQRDKLKSLNEATRDISRLNFAGRKALSTQVLEFPRKYDYIGHGRLNFDPYNNLPKISDINCNTAIPDDIKIACCEIAIKYLEGVDIEQEMINLNVNTQRFASVHESYSLTATIEAYRAGINSSKAWTYLKPYLVDSQELRIVRTS